MGCIATVWSAAFSRSCNGARKGAEPGSGSEKLARNSVYCWDASGTACLDILVQIVGGGDRIQYFCFISSYGVVVSVGSPSILLLLLLQI